MAGFLGLIIVIGAVLVLCLYAFLLRRIVVRYAKYRGYTADNMPILYHMVAFGVYFSTLIVIHGVTILVGR